jgi:hypothetical protein
MKIQAWGWLGAAVLAAGLNSSYHNGGLQWAHEIADRVQHNTGAVLALATGRADEFLAEARMLRLDRDGDVAISHEDTQCPFATAWAHAQSSIDQSQAEFDRFQALSDREQAKLARLEANRARIEARVQANLARMHLADNTFRFERGDFSFADTNVAPVVVDMPRIHCPRVRVATPHVPRVRVRIPRIEVPAVRVDNGDDGPI